MRIEGGRGRIVGKVSFDECQIKWLTSTSVILFEIHFLPNSVLLSLFCFFF